MFPFFDTGTRIGVAMSALYALLAVTSLSVKLATRGTAPGMLGHQVNAWWRIFPVVSFALLTYPLGLIAFAYLICLLALVELEPHHGGHRYRFWLESVAILAGLGFLGWQSPSIAALLIAGGIVVQTFVCWYHRDSRSLIQLLVAITIGAMYALTAFCTLPFGVRANLAWLFYLFILTALNDIGQFVAGKLFGRHKIAPTISPNKTWQGFAGGILVSQIVSFVLGMYLSLADPLWMAICGLLLSAAGLAGDLMFSAAKRYLSIKDFSQLIPGHGGILDRIDSLVLTAPLLYGLLHFMFRSAG